MNYKKFTMEVGGMRCQLTPTDGDAWDTPRQTSRGVPPATAITSPVYIFETDLDDPQQTGDYCEAQCSQLKRTLERLDSEEQCTIGSPDRDLSRVQREVRYTPAEHNCGSHGYALANQWASTSLLTTHPYIDTQQSEDAYQSGHDNEDTCRMDYLLGKLKHEVKDLRSEGENLTRQMWLLHATVGDFVHTQCPHKTTDRPLSSKQTTEEYLTHEEGYIEIDAKLSDSLTDIAEQDFVYLRNKLEKISCIYSKSLNDSPPKVVTMSSTMAEKAELTFSGHHQTISLSPKIMREFQRSHSEPRRRIHGSKFYDSYTDKLVRDVVRLTFFGNDSPNSRGGSKDNSPVASLQGSPTRENIICSPAKSSPNRGEETPERDIGQSGNRPPIRRLSSPLTVSSGYESESEYILTKEKEIDVLFHSTLVNNSLISTNNTTKEELSRKAIINNADEYIISPDDLYVENHPSFLESTPSKHQTQSETKRMTRAPIKSDLNSPRREPKAHQDGIHSSTPIQLRHSSSKTSPKLSKSPSDRKLTKVAKSMQHIISDLGQIEAYDDTQLCKDKQTSKGTTLNCSLSAANEDTSFSSIQVPLTSTPQHQSAPEVTYRTTSSVFLQRDEPFDTTNRSLSTSINAELEQSSSYIVAHMTHSYPSTPDNALAHNRALKEECNQAQFEHHPQRFFAHTPDNKGVQFDDRQQIKGRTDRGLSHTAGRQTGHSSNVRRQDRNCERMMMRRSVEDTFSSLDRTDVTVQTSSSFVPSFSTIAMPSSDSEVSVCELNLTDLKKESVKSIRVRPTEMMFDEDFYLRPRKLQFNGVGVTSGAESSFSDSTLLLNHLQENNSDFWNSQLSSVSSVPSSPRNSTISSDSGRGSTSAMDIHELRCDSELENSLMYDADTEPIYETIPDELVSDESDSTLCEELQLQDFSKRERSHLENTYATIDGDTADGYVTCSSYHEYSSLSPPEPPARNATYRMSLPARSSYQQQKLNRGNHRSEMRCQQAIKRTDIISSNPYHVYTVGDILESFHRFAANIPSSPAVETNSNKNKDIYSQVQKPTSSLACKPCDTQVNKQIKQCVRDIHRRKGRTETKDRDLNNNCYKPSSRCRPQLKYTTKSYSSYKNSHENNNNRNISYHQRVPQVTQLVTAHSTAPVWNPSVSQLQGTLC